MQELLNFLTSMRIAELASDPKVLAAAGVLFFLAVIFRWKSVLLLLFALAGTLAVARYSNLTGEGDELDPQMLIFAWGFLLIGVVLIYFLFIKGD